MALIVMGDRKLVRNSGSDDMNRIVIWGAVLIGIALLVLTGIYWLEPAGALPTYLPGFEAGSTRMHFKHGLGTLILALVLFAFAWFQSGPRKA
jgi:hypothetical protein